MPITIWVFLLLALARQPKRYLFKTALEANPNIAQFWLSYIDALIKLERLADAKAVFDQAKSKGAKGDGFDKLEKRLDEARKDMGVNVTPKKLQEPSEKIQLLIDICILKVSINRL